MNKRKSMLLFAAMSFFGVSAQRITAVNEVIDCGNVVYEVPVTVKFEMRNKGNDLVINDVRTSCGCVVADYPKGEIKKGDSFVVSATYDARQLGHFEKQVAIFSNASSKPYYLKLRGVVVEELEEYSNNYEFAIGSVKVDKNDIEFDDVNKGDFPIQKIHIYNSGSKEVRPVLMHLPDYISATISPTVLRPGRVGVATIKLNSHNLHDLGLTQTSIYLGMYPGDKVSKDKEITLSAVLLPAFDNMSESQKANAPVLQLSTSNLDLGEFNGKSSKSGTVILQNVGKSTLDIRSMQMFTEGLKVRLNKTKLAPGESAKLRVTAYRKLLKNVRSKPRVLMITNDPDNPKVTVNIIVK